jgi:predicted extracellular nuclease
MNKILLSLSFVFITTFSFSQCNNLFISEYIEGSGNNKAIEIYNPTGFTVPLTGNFSIRMYFNGSGTPTNFPLTGSGPFMFFALQQPTL